jgi:prolyl-tRNA editing enzyme YbaK/EbsC (Cys-tRNA(Pro) deacylase)
MLTPNDLQAYLQANAIQGEIVILHVPTPTVEMAARAVGTRPEQIVKSILFVVEGRPVLVIANGLMRVDRRAIATYCKVSRKRVRLATAGQVVEFSGYDVGAMPPFGHCQSLLTLLDWRVLELSLVYAGGGAENALLRLAPGELLRATRAHVMDLMADPEHVKNHSEE